MEMDLCDSKSSIVKIKPEYVEYPCLSSQSCFSYSHHEIECSKAECVVAVMKEECDDVSVLDSIGVAQNVSDGEIAHNDIKIKLDLSRDDSFNSYSDKEPGEQGIMRKDNNICGKHHKSSNKLKCTTTHSLQTRDCEGNYECEICNKCFTKKRYLSQHAKTHVRERNKCELRDTLDHENFKCETCDKSFPTNQAMSRHVKTHIEKGNYKCELCDKSFTTNRNYSRHVKTHMDGKNYKCEICDKCFAAKKYVLDHMKAHTGQRNFKCETCNKSFIRKHHLTQHSRTHDGQKNKCEICDKYFATDRYLLDHLKAHAGERNFKCDVCEKSFARKQHLSQHAKTHTSERNYECEICSKRYTAKQHLSQHYDTHTSERNYKCDICDKCFAIKRNLSRHIKTHVGERNKCEYCDKTFSRRQYMLDHAKAHSGERRFKCGTCDKSFTTKHHLLKHFEIHTDERKYKCEICDKRFATQQYLSRHAKTHTGKRNFKSVNLELWKRKVMEEMKRHEGSGDEEPVRNFSCVALSTTKEEIYKPLIKEEDIGGFVTEDNLEMNNGTTERKMSTNESGFESAVKEEKPTLIEILNLPHTFHNEIMFKEESTMDTTLLMDAPSVRSQVPFTSEGKQSDN